MYPVPSYKIGTPFGAKCCGNTGRPHYWSLHIHKGVDISAPPGTPVLAVWGGRVIDASWGRSFGTQVIIDTDTLPDGTAGLWVGYMHLRRKFVRPGDRVEAGDKIGEVGMSGNTTGPHLHLEVQRASYWRSTGYFDPRKWLAAEKFTYLQDKKVYASKMVYDQRDSDSVRNIQIALNEKNSAGLPTTGNFLDMTRAAVTKWQEKQGWSGAGADGIPGPLTASTLDLTWVDDVEVKPPPIDPPKDNHSKIIQEALADLANVKYVDGWDNPDRAGNDTFAPEYVLMHHSGGTNSLGWLLPGGKYDRVCGANFLVDVDGTINVLSAFKSYHAGKGSYADVPVDRMNDFSWGIEIENLGTSQNMPEVQIRAAAQLAGALISMMQAPISHVINHKTYSSTKPDTLYSDEFWQNRAAGIELPVEYLTKDVADDLYLSIDTDYLNKAVADTLYAPSNVEYLTVTEADSRYMSIDTTLPEGYLTQAQADELYLPVTTNYLTWADIDGEFMPFGKIPEHYEYTGKPNGTQDISDGRYEKIDNGFWTPPKDGFMMSMIYANCEFKFKPGFDTGTIRVRAVRNAFGGESSDNTAYKDFTVTSNHFGDRFLITHDWWELAEGGRKVHWEIKCSDHFESVVLGTRYTKWVLFPR